MKEMFFWHGKSNKKFETEMFIQRIYLAIMQESNYDIIVERIFESINKRNL